MVKLVVGVAAIDVSVRRGAFRFLRLRGRNLDAVFITLSGMMVDGGENDYGFTNGCGLKMG